ncbi:MAG: transcriptional regulator [Nitrospiraceae bacterium]|nr:transcriptional regulator [Nitrospiraceae bacterium]
MPIYEYQCTGCAYRFEVKQSIKDDPIKECTRCGQPVTKLISPPAIMFKGSGWYITDYSDKLKPGGGNSSGEKPAATGGDQAKAPATAESGTAAKPAAAAAPSTSTTSTPAAGSSSSSGSSSSGSSTT